MDDGRARQDGSGIGGADGGAFEIVLYPNRPLGPRGQVAVIGGVAVLAGALGVGFAMVGAWPVSGLLGLDIVALALAFRIVRRRARQHEMIRLDAGGLVVSRFAANGSTASWRFEPTWARVEIDQPPRRDSLITVSSHGRSLRFGAFLTPEERVEVAHTLRDALSARRDALRAI